MIAIWNKGTTIKREDVASKVPLQIVAPANAEILEIQLLYTDEANNIQYTFSDNRKKIIIDFEYLAKNEGVVMKLFHTCGEKESLKVHCALRSGIKIQSGITVWAANHELTCRIDVVFDVVTE